MEENPREYKTRFLARSRTSKKYVPRLVESIGRLGLPGQGSGSITMRSTLKISCPIPPVWKKSSRIVAVACAAIAELTQRASSIRHFGNGGTFQRLFQATE